MELKKIKLTAVLAEFVGTFGFAFAILATVNGAFGGITAPVVAALTLAVIVMVFGVFSGAHVNPAVTFGAWTMRKLDTLNTVAYWVAQFAGAFLAMYVLKQFADTDLVEFSPESNWTTFLAEGLGALFLGLGMAGAWHHKYQGVASALTIGLALLIGIGFAGVGAIGFINPSVAAAADSFNWAYALGPVAGVTAGMWMFHYFFAKK